MPAPTETTAGTSNPKSYADDLRCRAEEAEAWQDFKLAASLRAQAEMLDAMGEIDD